MSENMDEWSILYKVPRNCIGPRRYVYTIIDTSGNRYETEPRTFTIFDDDRPVFLKDLSDDNATTSDPFHLRVQVEDNIDVEEVRLRWWKEGWNIKNNETMSNSNGLWVKRLMADSSNLEPIYYSFFALDGSGNHIDSKEGVVKIKDNDAPEFKEDLTDDVAITGGTIGFRIDIFDNIEISSVKVNLERGDGVIEQIQLHEDPDLTWSASIEVPIGSVDHYEYMFEALDSSGNVNSTQWKKVEVTDTVPAVIEEFSVPDSGNAGSDIRIELRAIDNIGIDKVILKWWYGGSAPTEVMMESQNGEYQTTIGIPIDSFGTLYITAEIIDLSGNSVTSERKDVFIIEYDPGQEDDTNGDDDRIPKVGEDLDSDGMDDLWEFENGLDIEKNDSGEDLDGDGFSNLKEYLSGTDPGDPSSSPKSSDDDNTMILIVFTMIFILLLAMIIILLAVLSRGRTNEKGDRINSEHGTIHSYKHHSTEQKHGSDKKHPVTEKHHSYPLTDEAISHPHHHPVHSQGDLGHKNRNH
jgi:hypothetical protein